MKWIVALTSVLLVGIEALACAPAPAHIVQRSQLAQAISSPQFNAALDEQIKKDGNVSIKRIDFKNTLDVNLSNKCTIKVRMIYNIVRPGACPQVSNIETNTICVTVSK